MRWQAFAATGRWRVSQSVVVIGAGISGLVTARTLATSGVDVTVLERQHVPGGQIRTAQVAGLPVDVGAEALHVAGPHVTDLLAEVGVADLAVGARTTWTWIWTRRGLRRLPAGMGPAGPTRLAPLIGSRVLGPVGLARAALEPLVPRESLDDDVSVGAFLSRRFGRRVVQQLVDPLLGSLHAGDVSRLSLRAATPYLAAVAANRRSLMLGPRPAASSAPTFLTFPGGLTVLVEALAAHPAVTVRCGVGVSSVDADRSGVRVELDGGESLVVDAVVLAVPAAEAAAILGAGRDGSPPVAGLAHLNAASVVTAVVAYPRADVERESAFGATGVLVPPSRGRFLKAATFLSQKWPHLSDPGVFLVRMSAGRYGDTGGGGDITTSSDQDLVGRLHADLAEATGLRSDPSTFHVQRWPRAMPQLEVGHLERMAAIRSALPTDAVLLAGAPYDGVGIASCIRSGRAAASRIIDGASAVVTTPT